MNAVFQPKEFQICNVPVPKGYPQSQTHAGVAYCNGRVYLTTSPYPSVKYKRIVAYARAIIRKLTNKIYPLAWGDILENPMLYFGEKDEIAPVRFNSFVGNPLVPTPPRLFGLPAFNSDPDILILPNEYLYVLNREVIRKKKCEDHTFIYHLRINLLEFSLNDGLPIYQSSTYIYETSENIGSPSIRYINGLFHIFYLDTTSYCTGSTECNLYVRTDNDIKGKYADRREILIESKAYTPWHLSVFDYKGKLYAIIACIKDGVKGRCYQMLGEFNENMTTFRIYQKPLVDIPSYRGAAFVSDSGEFILYSTTVYYKLKGSKSVDSRDVFMVRTDFEYLLNELKNA